MADQNFTSARKALASDLSAFLYGREAEAESWRWFEEGLDRGRAWMVAHGDEHLPDETRRQLETWLNRRKTGEPWAYILGWAAWRGRRFSVTPATLIPRPETEQVFETALLLADKTGSRSIADIGTGAGILGISLALDTSLEVTATDICSDVLSVAKQNAHANGATLKWACGDLMEPLPHPVDLVVSNPPYIALEDEPTLSREISFEPREALFAPDSGMEVIARLLRQAFDRRVKGAVIEIGAGQGSGLKCKALEIGWRTIEIKQDMAGHDRVLIALL
jgi:release factor glutamine methyltransferase